MRECYKLNHVDYVNDLNEYKQENLTVKGGKLVLGEMYKEGYVESCEIKIPASSIVVGAWAAVTGLDNTVELLVKVCVEGQWSKYFSYGNWGLYRENYYYNDEDDVASINVDEIIIKNNKLANKVQYKIILRKEGSVSPKLSLVALNFKTDLVPSTALATTIPCLASNACISRALPKLSVVNKSTSSFNGSFETST